MFRLFLYLYEMEAKELIYNLRTNLAGVDSQLAKMTDQHIMYMLDEARAKLASQKMDSRVNVVQMSQYVDVKPVKAPKEIMGTVGTTNVLQLEIPKPISYSNGLGVLTVGSTDGKESYTQISYSQLRTALSRKYTAKSAKWFLLDDKLYVVNVEIASIKLIRVRAIFDEPYRVEQAMGRYKYLKPFNWEYPLTLKDADTIYKMAMNGDLGWGDTAMNAVLASKQRQAAAQKQDE